MCTLEVRAGSVFFSRFMPNGIGNSFVKLPIAVLRAAGQENRTQSSSSQRTSFAALRMCAEIPRVYRRCLEMGPDTVIPIA